MVAVVSGSGLGLFGSTGGLGNSLIGRGSERVFVNTTTGNLVLQGVDETLTSRGLDLALVRTYNSQGLLDDDNGDNWRLGVQQRVHGLTGTLNTEDSTVTKVFGDGRAVQYRYDLGRSAYVSSEGEGAHDTLTNSAGTWTWTDGSGHNTETYDSSGRLATSADADGNTVTYSYNQDGFLDLIVDASGQETHLDYDGDQLTAVRVISDGYTQTLTRYAYDSEGRLHTVTLDLSPEDNDIVDGDVYVTTYTYEGNTRRIASVTQTDGSSVTFTYQQLDGGARVHTVTDALGRVTTFTYGEPTSGGTQIETVDANTGVLLTTESSTDIDDYEIITSALVTNGTQTVTNNYGLNGAALTTPSAWAAAAAFDSSPFMEQDPRMVFRANGNGIAVWRNSDTLYYSEYHAASQTWSWPSTLQHNPGDVRSVELAMDPSGNAVVAYVQYDYGTSNYTVRARTFNSSYGYWNDEQTLIEFEAGSASTVVGNLAVDIQGSRAGIAWVQAGENNSLYYTELSSGYWTGSTSLLENSAAAVSRPVVTVGYDSAIVAWRQSDGTAESVYANRFDSSTWNWSGPTLLENSSTAIEDLAGGSDFDGNSYFAWRSGGDLLVRTYNGGWSPANIVVDTRSETVGAFAFALDRNGGVPMLAWVQSDGTANSVYVSTGNWEIGRASCRERV